MAKHTKEQHEKHMKLRDESRVAFRNHLKTKHHGEGVMVRGQAAYAFAMSEKDRLVAEGLDEAEVVAQGVKDIPEMLAIVLEQD